MAKPDGMARRGGRANSRRKGRGRERTRIFQNDGDREDLLARLADVCRARALSVYAWALLPNRFHLLVRTGEQPLPQSMKPLLTGYLVNFNRFSGA